MKSQVEVGQFWRNISNRYEIVEILDIEHKDDKYVQSKVRKWAQTGKEIISLLDTEPHSMKVFSDEFRYWKLIDIDGF